MAVQGCSWQKCENVKPLNESGKDFAHRESSECGCGGEVCAEQLPQNCAHPRDAAQMCPSQLSSVKQKDGFGIPGREMCGHNTAVVGGGADGKARAVVSGIVWTFGWWRDKGIKL